MGRSAFGLVADLIFGALVVGMMLPMSFPDERAALAAAFISRFSIGLFASTVQLPFPPWGRGLIGGLLIGIAAARWAS